MVPTPRRLTRAVSQWQAFRLIGGCWPKWGSRRAERALSQVICGVVFGFEDGEPSAISAMLNCAYLGSWRFGARSTATAEGYPALVYEQ